MRSIGVYRFLFGMRTLVFCFTAEVDAKNSPGESEHRSSFSSLCLHHHFTQLFPTGAEKALLACVLVFIVIIISRSHAYILYKLYPSASR